MLQTAWNLHHKEGLMLSKAGTHHEAGLTLKGGSYAIEGRDLHHKAGVMLPKVGTYTTRLDLHHKEGLML
jgi:hypothetical protein